MDLESEKAKMLAGKPYIAADSQLSQDRLRARALTRQFNTTTELESDKRQEILRTLFGQVGPHIDIEPDFRCDYGYNIYVGDYFYANFNCVILDCAEVRIGHHVLFAPNVQLYTAYHPLDPATRASGLEMASPVTIGDNVWIGGGSIINPGVTIGSNTTIGAGSVVTRNIPDNVVAVGNPCRVIRSLV